MTWPKVVMVVWIAFVVIINLMKHGEPREGTYNFIQGLLSMALLTWILAEGGFWSG